METVVSEEPREKKRGEKGQGTFLVVQWLRLLVPKEGSPGSIPGQGIRFRLGFPAGSEVKVSASNVGDPGLIPGLGRSPGQRNGNPLQ